MMPSLPTSWARASYPQVRGLIIRKQGVRAAAISADVRELPPRSTKSVRWRAARAMPIPRSGCIVDVLLHRPRFYRLRRAHRPLAPAERLDLGCFRSQGALEARAGEWFAIEPHPNCQRSCPRGERASVNRVLSALVPGHSADAWIGAAGRQI